jgi:hypothetical protein
MTFQNTTIRRYCNKAYIMKMSLLLLIGLKDVEKLLVCTVISISGLYLVEVMYGMVEFSWRLSFDGISIVIEVAQDGSGCRRLLIW